MIKRHLKSIIKWSLGFLILVILFYKVGLNDIFYILKDVKIIFLIFSVLSLIGAFVTSAFKLQILLLPVQRIKFKKIWRYFVLSWAIGKITPGRIGEFSIAFFLKDEKVTIGEGISVSLVDKLTMFIISVLMAAVGIVIFFSIGQAVKFLLIAIILLLIVIGLIASNKVRNFIKRYILRKYKKQFKGFSKVFFELLKRKKIILISSFVLSIVKLFFLGLTAYFAFLALGYKINVLIILIIMALENMVSLIPITVNGLGIKQGAGIFLYSLIGVEPTITASRYVINLSINYISTFFIILFMKK